jgi:prephenate dehydrogenase
LNPANLKLQSQLCASGFRDTTRIASGSPEMWRDIALSNRKNLARSLDTFISELQKFQRTLKSADAKAISKFFETAKSRRDNWHAETNSISSE